LKDLEQEVSTLLVYDATSLD